MATVTKGTTSAGTGAPIIPVPATDQMNKRDVFDRIILNFAQNTPLLIMLAKGIADETGMTQGKGLISRRAVKSDRYEVYNHNPITLYGIVGTAGLNVNGTTLAFDTTNLKKYDTVLLVA